MKKMTVALVLTTFTTALIAGLFYSYSCSVNVGLGSLPDREYLSAMQSINVAILNPLFFLSFMGTLVLLPVCTYLHYQQPGFTLLLSATIIYVVGSFGVTIFGNVPLNEMLAQVDLQDASPEQIASVRGKFETAWNNLHTVRTTASAVSLVFVIVACIKSN
jgi:uncharacterized membrane protein